MIRSLKIFNLSLHKKHKWDSHNISSLHSAEVDSDGNKDDTPRPLPPSPLPPPRPHPLVGAVRGGCQGEILGLLCLGLCPGIGMVGALGLVGLPPGRTRPTMTITTTIISGVFGGEDYPMSLPNCQYFNPPHPQVQIPTSRLTLTLHGMKVWCVPTHQLNALLQAKCGGPQGQCIGSYLKTQSGVTNTTHTSAFLYLKVHKRAWSVTRLLRCPSTITRIVHCGLLLNW